MEVMIGYRPFELFKWCWKIITPAISLAIWIFSVATWTPLVYESYVYPPWGVAIGMLIALSSMTCIPAWVIFSLVNTQGSITERLRKLTTPNLRPNHHHQQIPNKLEMTMELEIQERMVLQDDHKQPIPPDKMEASV